MPKKIKVVDIPPTDVETVAVNNEPEPFVEAKPVEANPVEDVPVKPKKPRVKKPKPEPVVEPVVEPVKAAEAEPIVEGIQTVSIDAEIPKKDVKTLELVQCDKCNRKMTERTLKYAHEDKCPALNPTKPRTRKSKISQQEESQKQPQKIEPEYEEELQPVKKDLISVRREKINQKKEPYKA